ncbi:NAD-dependent epimerase/dehydratase family protein [Mycobacterium sp. MS1601]|uniref:NAD-dependent epimerase/dehydratase family protein n=1 Tax=Mycobacterium sp. MS1601 TaxID=1936029 RepID=UPI00267D76EF
MNITIVGATGQIGTRLVSLLSTAGHRITAASRQSGVDATTGVGLDEALSGADVLIDVLNSPTMEDDAALAFFVALRPISPPPPRRPMCAIMSCCPSWGSAPVCRAVGT